MVPELWSYRNCCCQCPLHVHLSKCGVNGSVHWYAQEASTGKIKKNSGEPERIASSRLTLHNLTQATIVLLERSFYEESGNCMELWDTEGQCLDCSFSQHVK